MFSSLRRFARTVPVCGLLLMVPLLADAKPYKSAEVFTLDSELYGKYVIRMRAGKGSGLISAFFLWKEGSELEDVFWEEVDIEVLGKDGANAWQSNIITGLGTKITSEEVHPASGLGDSYHTFTLEWTPDRVRWLIDGQLVREVNGNQASALTSPAQARMNFWPANIAEWVGPFDDSILPVHMYVNWMEYHRWDGQDFQLSWRDDFDSLDPSRWGTADWTFAENSADFTPSNVTTRDGYLVLSMTHEGQEGYNGTPPQDTDGGTPEPDPEPEPEPEPEPTPGTIGCSVTGFNQWGSGYQMDVTVTNDTNSAINGWVATLGFDQDPQVTNSWSANLQASASDIVASSLSWNANLAPGSTATFGVLGNANGSISTPDCTATAN